MFSLSSWVTCCFYTDKPAESPRDYLYDTGIGVPLPVDCIDAASPQRGKLRNVNIGHVGVSSPLRGTDLTACSPLSGSVLSPRSTTALLDALEETDALSPVVPSVPRGTSDGKLVAPLPHAASRKILRALLRAESAPALLERSQRLRRRSSFDRPPVTRAVTARGRIETAAAAAVAAVPRLPLASIAEPTEDSAEPCASAAAGSEPRAAENESLALGGEERRGSDAEAQPEPGGEAWPEPGGEAYPEFLVRAAATVKEEGLKDEPGALFEAFRTSDDLRVVFAAFARLFDHATCPGDHSGRRGSGISFGASGAGDAPWAGPEAVAGRRWRFPYEPIRLVMGGNWKAKKLWKLLDERVSRAEYMEPPCEAQRALVVGAGPCGLRAAIELRLLGARTTVVDRRSNFSRINQLHIWSWCGEDLKGLGARVLEPPPSDFGSNPDLLHVSISDLQKLLLKVALLLGVEVFLGTDFVGAEFHHDGLGEWRVRLGPPFSAGGPMTEGRAGESSAAAAAAQEEALPPSPRAPSWVGGVSAVFGANGFGSRVGEENGLRVEETTSLRPESAVGVICNFARANGAAERRLRSFSMAKQFYLPLFKKAAATTGAELENIVYTKSHLSHYFVMTPSHRSLIEAGVVVDRGRRPLLARDNVDLGRLDALVRRIAAFPFKAGEQPVLLASQADAGEEEVPYADSGPRLFDFSRMRRQAEMLTFLRPPPPPGEASGDGDGSDPPLGDEDCLLLAIVGDALLEPFWPEGLGIVRGFFSALDACAAVSEWSSGASTEEVRAFAEGAFAQLKTLSAATRRSVLKDNETLYGLPPATRYRRLNTTATSPPRRSLQQPQPLPPDIVAGGNGGAAGGGCELLPPASAETFLVQAR